MKIKKIMNKQNIMKWVTYILNMLLFLPFAGVISIGIFYFAYEMSFPHSNPVLWAKTAFPVLLFVPLMVLWGGYQYKNIILTSPVSKRDKLKNAVKLGGIILIILFAVAVIGFLALNFMLKGRDFTDYGAEGAGSLSMRYVSKERHSYFFPVDAKNIRITGHSGGAYYAWWTCNCSEQSFRDFARGNGFELKNEMISVGMWESDGLLNKHIENARKQNGGLEPEVLSCQIRWANNGGYSFLYIKSTNMLFGYFSNR